MYLRISLVSSQLRGVRHASAPENPDRVARQFVREPRKRSSILCISDTSCTSFLEPVSTLIILLLKGERPSVKQDKLGRTVVGAVNCPLSLSDSDSNRLHRGL